jgi:hypothetical protein
VTDKWIENSNHSSSKARRDRHRARCATGWLDWLARDLDRRQFESDAALDAGLRVRRELLSAQK